MLSPHEFATLLLVKDAPNQVDMEREELDALFERQLVQLEKLASGLKQWRLTEIGDSAIRAIKRFSSCVGVRPAHDTRKVIGDALVCVD